MLEVQIVAFFKPIVRDSLVGDVLLWGVFQHIVVRETCHAGVSQPRSVEYFVAESTIHLQGYVEVLISEADVRTKSYLGRGLSGNVSVAAIAQVHFAVVVNILYVVRVAAVLVFDESLAVWKVKHAKRLSYNLIDNIVVAAVLPSPVQ